MAKLSNSHTPEPTPTWRPFIAAREHVHSVGLNTVNEFREWAKSDLRPADIPPYPNQVYSENWEDWADWLGTAPRDFHEAREYAQSLGLNTRDEWVEWTQAGKLPRDIPKWPQNIYKGKGWVSWEDWLGRRPGFRFRPFDAAREFARSLKLKSRAAWNAFVQSDACPKDIPSSPGEAYPDRWLGIGDWLGNHSRWNRTAILAFLTSLRPFVQELEPAEVYAILREKKLVGKKFPTNSNAPLIASLEQLCSGHDQETHLQRLTEQLERTAAESDPEEENPIVVVEDELPTVPSATLSMPTPLPRLRSHNSLKVLDLLFSEHDLDDEDVLDFLVGNRVAALWQEALSGNPEQLFERLQVEQGGAYFQRIRERFAEQYAGAMSVIIPADYSFRRDGELVTPNLMQRLVAYLLITGRRMGNWSGVGAGKTLSAVLASRVMGAQLTVIVAVNATIDRWEEAIREAFPNSHVHAKDVPTFTVDSSRPNYLLLNFESFQQVWSDQFVQDLVSHHKIDFIVVDEVQSVRQRTAEKESQRRALVRSLIIQSAAGNPELRVLGMSATPVINNLHEAKTLLELVTGDELYDLPVKPTVDNAIRTHQKLVRHGIRYRPSYSLSLVTSHPEVDGHPWMAELRQVPPRDLLGMDKVLLKAKLTTIVGLTRPGTMIYTQFVTEIVDPLQAALEHAGHRVGVFTGTHKGGIVEFCGGRADVLIGSAPVGTGVDGLQKVCDRLIFVALPWTAAEYEQIVGRLNRQGSNFHQIEVVVPQVVLRRSDGSEWSWDKSRWERIQWKRTLADAAVDGVVPQGQLPSKTEMQAQSQLALTAWLNRLENDGGAMQAS